MSSWKIIWRHEEKWFFGFHSWAHTMKICWTIHATLSSSLAGMSKEYRKAVQSQCQPPNAHGCTWQRTSDFNEHSDKTNMTDCTRSHRKTRESRGVMISALNDWPVNVTCVNCAHICWCGLARRAELLGHGSDKLLYSMKFSLSIHVKLG